MPSTKPFSCRPCKSPHATRDSEDYRFEVREIAGKWFVMDPTDLCPHVSLHVFKQHIHELLQTEPGRQELNAKPETLETPCRKK